MNRLDLLLKAALVVLTVTFAGVMARADVVPIPPSGRRFVRATVHFEGLTDPAWVLVAWSPGQTTIFKHAAFGPAHPESGFNRDGSLDGVVPRLFPRADYEAWLAKVSEVVEAQREACFKRGEGCIHPSRFAPSYPAPTGGVDCALPLQIPVDGPETGPGEVRHSIRVVALGPDTCRLETVAAPFKTRRSGAAVPGCAVAGGVDLLAGLAGLLLVRRRRTNG